MVADLPAESGWKGVARSSPAKGVWIVGREWLQTFPPKAAGRALPVPALQKGDGCKPSLSFWKVFDNSISGIYDAGMSELPERNHLKRIPVWIPSDQRVIYFVTVCCAGRRSVFCDDSTVKTALESLIQCADAAGWNVLQICFMPDHVHLMVAPVQDREQKLSNLIQRWKSSSKQRLNRAGVEGDIWQREFFDRLLRSNENLTDKWRYAEMNPVRAGLCSSPEAYHYLGTPAEILNRL